MSKIFCGVPTKIYLHEHLTHGFFIHEDFSIFGTSSTMLGSVIRKIDLQELTCQYTMKEKGYTIPNCLQYRLVVKVILLCSKL